MGQEAQCNARLGKQTSAGKACSGKACSGKALLETDYVLFRGDFRVKIPFLAMKSVKARGAWLEIRSSEGALELELGEKAAAKWADKILHPPSRLDKLGVKAGQNVVVLEVSDPTLAAELADRGANVSKRPGPAADLIFFGAEKTADLERLAKLQDSLQPAGGIWIVYPKGVKAITEGDVLRESRAAGLVDVKICGFSATHTALKAVIPVAKRAKS
jgi:hypothetical protein